jgi:hypothetical protein
MWRGGSRLVTATECSRTVHPDVDHTATVLNVVRKLTRFWCSKQGIELGLDENNCVTASILLPLRGPMEA